MSGKNGVLSTMKGFEQNYELEKITKEYRDYALLIGDAVLNYTYGQKMEIKGDTVLSRYDNNGEITYRTGLLTPVGAIGGMFSFFALPDGIRLIDENGLPMDSRNISVKTSFRIEADKEDVLEGKKLKLIYSCPIPIPALVPSPNPVPTPSPFPDNNEEESDDSGNRSGSGTGSRTDIPGNEDMSETQMPVADLPIDQTAEELAKINDGEIPMVTIPKTGRGSLNYELSLIISGLLLMIYAAVGKKKEKK